MDNVMSSRVLSRFLPVAEGDVSVYEGFRREATRQTDLESQRNRTYNEPFRDDDSVPDEFLYDAGAEQETATDPDQSPEMMASPAAARGKRRTEDDEDVPASLLLEPRGARGSSRPISKANTDPKAARTEAQWRTTQEQQGLHAQRVPRSQRQSSRPSQALTGHQPSKPDPKANAMWTYTNFNNTDVFLLEVYQYYVQNGVYSMLLDRAMNLLTELFVFSFAMFLTTCVDYSKIPTSKSTGEVVIPKCMSKASWGKSAALFCFVIYWLYSLLTSLRDVRRLFQLHDFFLHVLGISDDDIQTVAWPRVVDGLVKVSNANVATANPSSQARRYMDYRDPPQRLSAETIANRLMRKSNYYVAFYNKDIFDFTLPLPFVGNRQFYSKSLEWAIDMCLTNFIFDEKDGVKPFCLDVKNRSALVTVLRSRLQFAAMVSIMVAPFNILRFCILFFFRYYTEFTKNPSRASLRAFTPFAEWKIREFNELDHLFQRRLRQATPCSNDYLKQFPKDKMDKVCRFVAFVSGAVAAVLTMATIFDSELFLTFEVTPGRTAFFWITMLGIVFTVSHSTLPDDDEVHDPVLHLKEVLIFTHYMPAHWKDRLHSNETRSEFSALFQMKVLIFAEEILSFIVAPWILWRNSGRQCERIIDFFREQTVHVDGIGYQCNFAVFGFKKDPNTEDPTDVLNEPDGLRDDYYGAKDDKMTHSVQHFMHYYSHHRYGSRRTQGWQPPPSWPPVISSSAIPEEPGNITHPTRRSHSAAGRQRHLVSTVRSPRQLAQVPRRGIAQRTEDNARTHGITESRFMAQDSDLQDFADAPGADQLESDTDVDEGKEAGVNAGVLGMLAQYTKAHTDKGVTAMNV